MKEESKIILLLLLFVTLVISLTALVKFHDKPDDKQYDNPDDCEDKFTTDFESQQLAQEIYQSKNCFALDRKGNSWYVTCCNEGNVRYEK